MLGAAIFTYGMLASFVLSGLTRNRKAARANPAVLRHLGMVLCGFSGAISLLLFGYAAAAHLTGMPPAAIAAALS